MRLLLDTHALLWFVIADPKLSARAEAVISDAQNEIFISPASYWEIAIKVSIGKYALSMPFENFLTQAIDGNQFESISIQPQHAVQVALLPFHHRDPFDRLLIAQAMVENLDLVSADSQFDAYSISRIW